MTGPIDHSPFAPSPVGRDGGIWSPGYVWVTVGAVALVFLAGMQSLAVTTVIPVVGGCSGGVLIRNRWPSGDTS